jgi:hypothetical protein
MPHVLQLLCFSASVLPHSDISPPLKHSRLFRMIAVPLSPRYLLYSIQMIVVDTFTAAPSTQHKLWIESTWRRRNCVRHSIKLGLDKRRQGIGTECYSLSARLHWSLYLDTVIARSREIPLHTKRKVGFCSRRSLRMAAA